MFFRTPVAQILLVEDGVTLTDLTATVSRNDGHDVEVNYSVDVVARVLADDPDIILLG